LIAAAVKLSLAMRDLLVDVLALQLILDGYDSLFTVFSLAGDASVRSDARSMEELTWLPATWWAVIWMLVSTAVLLAALRLALRPRRAPSTALLIVMLLMPMVVQSGAPPLTGIRSLAAAEGLPQRTVFALAEDARGYVYAGTQDGLSRWDGRSFTAVAFPAGTRDWVVRLLRDGDGLWAGTPRSGLYRIDDDIAQEWRDSDGRRLLDVQALTPAARGGVWVAAQRGLYRCSTGHACRLQALDPLPAVGALLESTRGEAALWVGTSRLERHALADDGSVRPQSVETIVGWPGSRVQALAEDAAGALWVGSDQAIARRDRGGWQVWQMPDAETPTDVRALALAPAGGVYAALWGAGLAHIDAHDAIDIQGVAAGLPEAFVQALLLRGDAAHTQVWLGSGASGVLRLEPGRWRGFDEHDGLPSRVVVGVGAARFSDGVEAQWVGTLGGAVRRMGDRWQALLPERYRDRVVYDVLTDPDGRIWYATQLGVLMQEGDRWQAFGFGAGQAAVTVSQLAWIDGALWIGSERGVARIDGAAMQPMFASSEPLAPSGVRAFASVEVPGRGPQLLLGSADGLALVSDGRIEALPAACASAGSVYDLEVIAADDIWIATRSGAVRLQWRAGAAVCTPVPEPGAAARTVYEIARDRQGRIYLFGYDGVRRFASPAAAAEGYERFGVEDGLPSPEFNRDAWLADDGRLWAANADGLVAFDPQAQPRVPAAAALQVDARQGAQALVANAVLPTRHDELVFMPRLLSFSHEHRIRYRTRLLGQDHEFAPWRADGDRRYAHLAPGAYQFEVEARDAAGHDHGPVTIAFRVAAPWWQHPLALVAAALALVGLGLLFGRLRARALRARAAALETLVGDRTRELELVSNRDPLTGAWNRRYFHARIAGWLRDSEAGGGLLVLLIDIDHFKRINDEHGHAAGDAVLVAVAACLRHVDGDSPLIRWGGEEFVLVLRRARERDDDARVAAVLRAVAQLVVTMDGQRIDVRCSIGCTVCRPPAIDIDAHIDRVMHRVDAALYEAKRQGRHRAYAAEPAGDGVLEMRRVALGDADGTHDSST
jgi:diguanylate cyclase (GGDEF)-like protein